MRTVDFPAVLKSVPCRQCTQSTSGVCANIGSHLQTQGEHVKAAYCNENFLVLWSDGEPHHPNYLNAIPRPPGGDGPYAQACVVRTFAQQSQTYKIPLTTTLLTTGSNTFPSGTKLNVIDLPVAGAVGVAVNGVPIYPWADNADKSIWQACEADKCNAHAGKGEDYHYHGDPFGPACLYEATTADHPQIIGWGLDGVTIYGRYTRADQDNQATPLDSCGGHTHGTYGYHYHAQVEQINVGGVTGFNAGYLAPKNCWKGDISKINNFWDSSGRQANYDNSKTSPKYTVSARNDYADLQPCCSMTHYYNATGITLNVEFASQDPRPDPSSSPSPTPGTSDATHSTFSLIVLVGLMLALMTTML